MFRDCQLSPNHVQQLLKSYDVMLFEKFPLFDNLMLKVGHLNTEAKAMKFGTPKKEGCAIYKTAGEQSELKIRLEYISLLFGKV